MTRMLVDGIQTSTRVACSGSATVMSSATVVSSATSNTVLQTDTALGLYQSGDQRLTSAITVVGIKQFTLT